MATPLQLGVLTPFAAGGSPHTVELGQLVREFGSQYVLHIKATDWTGNGVVVQARGREDVNKVAAQLTEADDLDFPYQRAQKTGGSIDVDAGTAITEDSIIYIRGEAVIVDLVVTATGGATVYLLANQVEA